VNIESVQLSQTISAQVASAGIQRAIPVGGTSKTSLTSDDVNIIYGFTFISGNTANDVKWDLAAGTLIDGASDDALTGLVSTQEIGVNPAAAKSILDENGVAIPAAATVVAIYYETDAVNSGDITITTSGTNGPKAGGTFTIHGDNGDNARSTLLIPRVTPTGITVNFTWTATADIIKVICLAKAS